MKDETKKRLGKVVLCSALLAGGSVVVPAAAKGGYTAPDPLDMRWTFGAHEPYTMYRRMGVRSTGGIHGNCRWLRDWFNWWDSEDCPKLMESLGLNWLLCRFYKGMGWEEEKKDFPNVMRFVENCHRHGVKALAYVQFSTLYPETMSKEIPDIENWAARDASGALYFYSRYFRWEPCFNEPKFEEYLKKVIRIALEEGKFDGVFFDNAYVKPCYCERCRRLFHEHLQTIRDPADRFGFDSLSGFDMPRYPDVRNNTGFEVRLPWGEVREPLLQEFNVWRTHRMTALFRRFYEHAHSIRPDCVVAVNACPYRAPNTVGNKSVDMTEFPKCFDLVMGQVNNCPHIEGDVIVNRVRDLKYAREFPATYFASCDGAAGDNDNEIEDTYLLPLLEDLVFGGVPADRTIMAPRPERPEFVSHARLARRRPQLAAFNAFAKANRPLFAAKDWMPVRFLVSQHAMMHSQQSFESLMASEGAALRGHVPFGYSISTEADPLPHALDAAVIVVANQTCLSDRQVAALVAYAKGGGRLVCIGEPGRYDEWNRQRFSNPLKDAVAGLPNAAWRDEPDVVVAKYMTHIKYAVHRPKGGVRPMLADLAKTGWRPEVEVVSAPETVFAQFKADASGSVCGVHLLNYAFGTKVTGVRLRLPVGAKAEFSAPFEEPADGCGAVREVEPGVWEVPSFTRYLVCRIGTDR